MPLSIGLMIELYRFIQLFVVCARSLHFLKIASSSVISSLRFGSMMIYAKSNATFGVNVTVDFYLGFREEPCSFRVYDFVYSFFTARPMKKIAPIIMITATTMPTVNIKPTSFRLLKVFRSRWASLTHSRQ